MPRAKSAPPLRPQLLSAGLRLGRADAAALTPAAVAKAAGTTAAALKREFGSFDAFRAELMLRWLDEIRDAVVDNLQQSSGPARLRRAVETWLDANRARPAVRALIRELRVQPAYGERVFERMRGFILVMTIEFRELGWLRAEAAGRLYGAMAIEIANAEFAQERVLPALRRTLFDALERS